MKSLLPLVLVVACASRNQGSSLPTRAAADLSCAESDIHLEQQAAKTFEVAGCGKSATYTQVCAANGSLCVWQMNETIKSLVEPGGYALASTSAIKFPSSDKDRKLRLPLQVERGTCYNLALQMGDHTDELRSVVGQVQVVFSHKVEQPREIRLSFRKTDDGILQDSPYCVVKSQTFELKLWSPAEISGDATLQVWSSKMTAEQLAAADRHHNYEEARDTMGFGQADHCLDRCTEAFNACAAASDTCYTREYLCRQKCD